MQNDFVITGIARIILVGAEEYPEPRTSFSAKLEHHELIYNLPGRSAAYPTVILGAQQVETPPGSIRFMPAGDHGRYEVLRSAAGNGCIDIVFDSSAPPWGTLTVLTDIRSKRIDELFRRAFAVWAARDDGYYYECLSLLYRIFAELQRDVYLPERTFAVLRPALDAIGERFDDPTLTCTELAAKCGISYSYLKQLFGRRFHLTPKQYILQMRMNVARDLLASEQYSVTQVAQMTGFSDVCYFSRQFKNAAGVTPTAFIKKYRSSK